MIESITIANTPPFGNSPGVLANLAQFNYLFGSNGAGKTTISRIIANQMLYPDCSITWRQGRPLETLVLNRDFVEKNFNQLKGIFTLGEEQKEIQAKISVLRQELDTERNSLSALKNTLYGEGGTGGKKHELAKLDKEFQDRCWAQKRKYNETLQGAFIGCRSDAAKFKSRLLDESTANKAPLKPLSDLEKRAETVFGKTPTREMLIPTIDAATLLAHEFSSILKKPVIGKDDVDIAAMINKLGNSDWVRQGRKFYEANDQACPFCQQETTKDFAVSLAEYFDETFEADSRAIDTLCSAYAADSSAIQAHINGIILAARKFLDVDKLKSQKAILDQTITSNHLVLNKKKNEPSQVVELESLASICTAIRELINAANAQIDEHNRMVDNLATEKCDLTAQVWRFVLNELEQDLALYRKNKGELDKAITNLNKRIGEANSRISTKQNEIRSLEKQTTSIRPTIDAVNAILSRFGFDNFRLAMGADEKSYRLVRHNGKDARETLSEGEKTFVVFLYFYHLLRGSTAEAGITTDRIVVFDDPVSSLDSDILFIVSSLIREICDDVRQGRGPIKQVFVFTHNVYFHREVTFNGKRKTGRLNEESFWIVRKRGQLSEIEQYESNPVKTSYELLWMDVRRPDSANGRIENILRRILEYYFTILGSFALNDVCEKFDGQDKLTCKSLLSWVNAGSHQVHDDLYVTPSDMMVQNYLRVFKAIFEKTGHPGHYEMMMGDEFVDSPAAAVSV